MVAWLFAVFLLGFLVSVYKYLLYVRGVKFSLNMQIIAKQNDVQDVFNWTFLILVIAYYTGSTLEIILKK